MVPAQWNPPAEFGSVELQGVSQNSKLQQHQEIQILFI
jgi:hypothetical protein